MGRPRDVRVMPVVLGPIPPPRHPPGAGSITEPLRNPSMTTTQKRPRGDETRDRMPLFCGLATARAGDQG